MTFKNKNILYSLMLTAAMLLLLPSCHDAVDSDNSSTSADGYALSLTVELPVTGETRVGESDPEIYEDYIDPAGIRLLFFDAEENTLTREFKSSQLSFIPIDLTSRYSKKWHVRIPVKSDEDADFIAAVRAKDFRIAVLANWPVTEDQTLLEKGENIDELHHLANDSYSSDEKKNIYGFLFNNEDDPAMGLTTDWVLGAEPTAVTDYSGIGTDAQKIPMYGIQKFRALENFWTEGTVFDLSDFDRMTPSSYEFSDIYLIRSVAKVELYIPTSYGAHHVFLRSQNRFARCEPVDVITDTKETWFDRSSNASANHSNNCEWTQLIGHTPFYDEKGDLSSYQNALAWYYSRWDNVTSTVEDSNWPHIINPVIDRSDFTLFIKTESDKAKYDRYVLYVPEKFVDDPDVAGDPTSAPKVCHIEFRGKNDPSDDLDDDNCFRIYFVDKGMTGKVNDVTFEKDDDGNDLNWENVYEKDAKNLQEHWPIMRNHNYVFTVQDANSRFLDVKVQILAWKKQEFTVSW